MGVIEREIKKYLERSKKISTAMAKIAIDLRSALFLACPVDTGILRGSIGVKADGMTLIISMNEYGKYVEYGTPPRIITPRIKKALAFKIEGEDVIVKKVKHPGTRPQPFIRSTIHTKLPKIIQKRLGGAG